LFNQFWRRGVEQGRRRLQVRERFPFISHPIPAKRGEKSDQATFNLYDVIRAKKIPKLKYKLSLYFKPLDFPCGMEWSNAGKKETLCGKIGQLNLKWE
jgi:hypothetical protein